MTDDELDRRLRDALRAEPSPDLAARIGEHVAATLEPSERWPWTPAVAGGLVAAVIAMAGIATNAPQRPAPEPSGAEPTQSLTTSTPVTALSSAAMPDPPPAVAERASTPLAQPSRPHGSAAAWPPHRLAPTERNSVHGRLVSSRGPTTATEPSSAVLAVEAVSIPALDITPLEVAPLVVAPLLVAPLTISGQTIEGGLQ